MSPVTASSDLAPDAADLVVIETRTTFFAAPAAWRPAINAYRCQDKIVVFVDLAGVPPDSVQLQVSPERLVIRGSRPAPEPDGEASDACQLLALEIDHGGFERSLEFPQPVNPDDVGTECKNGFLRIALGLRR